ncbi:VOC family protein [Cytobacillus spongiae]|uniref:VOC family protein n=1 Tax=Cytobacillus spongiae TaxID=2901381 RepID=UPI001F26F0B1|nr:VOC family protein [Cytobacillus spongiae]UII56869.1 VOC family protein [Cytobacillus spongiae]
MSGKLVRVGTTYLPVNNVQKSIKWYVDHLEAKVSYADDQKAIINFANQSFFLVKALKNQSANFLDDNGNEHFSLTFEVDGERALQEFYEELCEKGVQVGRVEDRGHPGRNFVFYDIDGNCFDVWSELSLCFKNE